MQNLKEVLVGNLKEFISFTNQYGSSVPALNFDCFLTNIVTPDSIPLFIVSAYSFLPFLVFSIILILRIIGNLFLKLILKKKQPKVSTNIPFYMGACFIITIYNFYSRLITNTFQLLKCFNLDQTSLTFLEVDPNVMCWEDNGPHKYALKMIFLPNLLIWCIGWPLTLFFLLKIKNSQGLKNITKKIASNKRKSSFEKVHGLVEIISNSNSGKSRNNLFEFEKIRSANRKKSRGKTDVPRTTLVSFVHQKNLFVSRNIINPSGRTTTSKHKSGIKHATILLNSDQKDLIFSENKILRFLTVDYKPEFFYWESFFYFTNLILATMNVATSRLDIRIKGAIYITIYFCMIIVHQNFYPFRHKFVNDLASFSYITSLITVGFVLMSANQTNIYFAFIISLNIIFYGCWIFKFAKIIFNENIIILKKICQALMNLLKRISKSISHT